MAHLAPKSNKDNNQNLALYITARRGKNHCLAASFKPKKAFFMMIELVVMHLSWFSCNHVSPSLEEIGITLFPKDPYDTFGCMNTFYSLYV